MLALALLLLEPRLFHVPTAYLAPKWGGSISTGIGSQGDLYALAATGMLEVADLEITLGDEIRADRAVVAMPTAQFRMGVGEGRLVSWQPAVALGFRRSIATRDGVDAAQLYLAASRRLGQFTLHIGGDLWDVARADLRIDRQVRPFAGLEWRPPWYPRTSILGEWSWIPEIAEGAIDLRWLAGWGVRYRAFDWLSLDLAVRFRENDKLGNTTVLLRANVETR